ncbi:MAG: hypothetical protein R3C11_04900 [Planctomycetaceae bacterium]
MTLVEGMDTAEETVGVVSASGPGSIFDTCCSNPCYDPCCGTSMGMAPPMMGSDCCTAPGPTWQSQPGMQMMPHSYESTPSSSYAPGPHLSVPTPVGIDGGSASYSSPSISSGLNISSHPESTGPVYQQSHSSPWIRAGF